MNHDDEPFNLETVDEYIEWLTTGERQDQPLPSAPDALHLSGETYTQLVRDLHHLTRHDAQRLARIRERLVVHATTSPILTPLVTPQDAKGAEPSLFTTQGKRENAAQGTHPLFQRRAFTSDQDTEEKPILELATLRSHGPGQQSRRKARQISRWTQVLVAVLVVGLVLGSLIAVLALHQQGSPGTNPLSACPAKHYPTLSPGLADTLTSVVALSANDAWAVGASSNVPFAPNRQGFTTLIEHWDGTRWRIVPSPNGTNGHGALVSVAAVSATNIWAVGSTFTEQGAQTLIEHWNGHQWSVLPSPNSADGNGAQASLGDDELNAVAAVSATDIWAIGQTATTPLIEHWDGRVWSIVSDAGGIAGALKGIAVISANDIWAVGTTAMGTTLQTNTQRSGLIEHWDGTHWAQISAPVTGQSIAKVSAPSTDDVWVLVYDAYGRALLEHWDGQQWSQAPALQLSPNEQGFVTDIVAVTPQDVWAVGFGMTHTDAVFIGHWDGNTWQQIPVSTALPPFSGGLYPGITASGTHQIWVVGSNNGQGTSALIAGLHVCPAT